LEKWFLYRKRAKVQDDSWKSEKAKNAIIDEYGSILDIE
jgi:hypothetical protein